MFCCTAEGGGEAAGCGGEADTGSNETTFCRRATDSTASHCQWVIEAGTGQQASAAQRRWWYG